MLRRASSPLQVQPDQRRQEHRGDDQAGIGDDDRGQELAGTVGPTLELGHDPGERREQGEEGGPRWVAGDVAVLGDARVVPRVPAAERVEHAVQARDDPVARARTATAAAAPPTGCPRTRAAGASPGTGRAPATGARGRATSPRPCASRSSPEYASIRRSCRRRSPDSGQGYTRPTPDSARTSDPTAIAIRPSSPTRIRGSIAGDGQTPTVPAGPRPDTSRQRDRRSRSFTRRCRWPGVDRRGRRLRCCWRRAAASRRWAPDGLVGQRHSRRPRPIQRHGRTLDRAPRRSPARSSGLPGIWPSPRRAQTGRRTAVGRRRGCASPRRSVESRPRLTHRRSAPRRRAPAEPATREPRAGPSPARRRAGDPATSRRSATHIGEPEGFGATTGRCIAAG